MPQQPGNISEAFYHEVDAVRSELAAQTDRGAAIVGAALMDEKLRQVLTACFVSGLSARDLAEMFDGPSAPLGTYGAKCRLGRAIGLYGAELERELRIIGRIRNRFAHDLQISEFSDPQIAPLCADLRGYRAVRIERDGTRTPLAEYRGPGDARRVFLASIDMDLHTLLIAYDMRAEGKGPIG